MSIAQIRLALIKRIVEADEEVLKKLFSLIESEGEEIIGYDVDGKAQEASSLRKELEEDLKEAKQGKYISLEEVKKRSDQWLKGTK